MSTHTILVLSDGETWQTFDSTSIIVMEVTEEGHELLLEGHEVRHIEDGDIVTVRTLAEHMKEAEQ